MLVDVRKYEKYFDMAFSGESLIVPKKENRSIVSYPRMNTKRLGRQNETLSILQNSTKSTGNLFGAL